MDVFKTVVSGVLVLVVGQVFLKMLIEPINKFKQTFVAISHAYLVHVKVLCSPDTASDEQRTSAQETFILLSGQLCTDLRLIPCYRIWRRVFFLPSETKVYEAARCLVAVGNWTKSSNTTQVEHIIKNWQTAADNLGLYIAPESRVSNEILDAAIRNTK